MSQWQFYVVVESMNPPPFLPFLITGPIKKLINSTQKQLELLLNDDI